MDNNAQYDQELKEVMRRTLEQSSCCVDVGAHSGGFLDQFLIYAPTGTHFAFEPIPHLYEGLKEKYSGYSNCVISDAALSDTNGRAEFKYVASNPGYSGLLERRYDRPNEEVLDIEVSLKRLDDVIPDDVVIKFIKIDVEGAELQVLQGGLATLMRCRPFVAFEHGLGSADVYGTTPETIFDLFTNQLGLSLFLMRKWLDGREGGAFSREEFSDEFNSGRNFFFLAAPMDNAVRNSIET